MKNLTNNLIIDNLIKKKAMLQSIQNKILKKSLDEYNQIYEIKLAEKIPTFSDENSDEIINLIETNAEASKSDDNKSEDVTPENVTPEDVILKNIEKSSNNLVETTSDDVTSEHNSEFIKENEKLKINDKVYISDDESIVIKAKSTKRKYTKRKKKKKLEVKNEKNA